MQCVRCNTDKDSSEFVNDRTRVTGKFPWCKECVKRSRRSIQEADAKRNLPMAKSGERACPTCLKSIEGMHANRLYCSKSCKDRARNWRVFGLMPDDYRMLVEATEGLCPICKRIPKRWVIDHNHETGEVTGVICSVCNQSLIAYSRHDVEVAQGLLDFLQNYPLRSVLQDQRFVGPEALAQMDRVEGWRRLQGYDLGLAHTPNAYSS